MGVPPNHPFIDGFSLTKTIYFGVAQSMETPIYPITPSKSDRFDPLQLENLEFYDTQAACWTSSSTFEGLHPSDGRMPIFFQNRFEYDSHKAIAIKKSPSILQAPWKICDTRIYIYIYNIYIYIRTELPFANMACLEGCVKRTTGSGGFCGRVSQFVRLWINMNLKKKA